MVKSPMETPCESLVHSTLVEKKAFKREEQKDDSPGFPQTTQEEKETSMQFGDGPKEEKSAVNVLVKRDEDSMAGAEQTAWSEKRDPATKSSSFQQKPGSKEGGIDVREETVQYTSAVNFQAAD